MGNPRPKPQHLAAKLLALRHKLGVGQLKLSRELGVDAVRIHDYETGKREPNLMVLLRYARLSQVPVESLIDDEINLPQSSLVLGDKVWCPRCGEYVKFVRVVGAARIVDVDRRTVYNYVKRNKVFAVKVAGSTLRVCSHCLLRDFNGAGLTWATHDADQND